MLPRQGQRTQTIRTEEAADNYELTEAAGGTNNEPLANDVLRRPNRSTRIHPANPVFNSLSHFSTLCHDNEKEALGDHLTKCANMLREMGLKREPYLSLLLVEHHFQDSGWRLKRQVIKSFVTLDKVLRARRTATLRRQMLFFIDDKTLLRNFSGHYEAQREYEKRWRYFRAAILAAVAYGWNLKIEFFELIELESNLSFLEHQFDLEIPSKKSIRPRCNAHMREEPGLLLQKCCTPEPFKQRWKYYISRPHSSKPKHEYAAIFSEVVNNDLLSRDAINMAKVPNCSRFFVLLSTKDLLKMQPSNASNDMETILAFDWPDLWYPAKINAEERDRIETIQEFTLPLPVLEDYFIEQQLVDTIVDRVASDLITIARYLHEQQFECRNNSNYSRINFVLHLQDTLDSLNANLDNINKAIRSTAVPSIDPTNTLDWSNVAKRDIKYLKWKTKHLNQESKKLDKLMRDQITAQRSGWERILTVTAAVYLPLTLATGVFGMNIFEIITFKPRWWTVVALGIPLVLLTIILPLISEQILRLFLRLWQFQAFRLFLFGLIYVGIYALAIFEPRIPSPICATMAICLLFGRLYQLYGDKDMKHRKAWIGFNLGLALIIIGLGATGVIIPYSGRGTPFFILLIAAYLAMQIDVANQS